MHLCSSCLQIGSAEGSSTPVSYELQQVQHNMATGTAGAAARPCVVGLQTVMEERQSTLSGWQVVQPQSQGLLHTMSDS
jgi:hypothetical protein